MKKIGFIGAGNMGTAMIRGLAQANLDNSEAIIVGGRNLEKLKPLEAAFTGLQITTDTEKTRRTSRYYYFSGETLHYPRNFNVGKRAANT